MWQVNVVGHMACTWKILARHACVSTVYCMLRLYWELARAFQLNKYAVDVGWYLGDIAVVR